MAVALKEFERRRLDQPEEDGFLSYPFLFPDGPISVIEFVCYANSFRSPICELIAEKHIRSLGLHEVYVVASSGTNVADLVHGHPDDFKKRVVEEGINRGFYTGHEKKEIEDALLSYFPEIVEKYFDRSNDIFSAEERMWKREVLKELGIKGKLKAHKDQVAAVPDRVAILTMSDDGLRHVSALYDQADFRPQVIDVLSRYATGNPHAIVHNSFGKKRDDYIRTVQDLMRYVPMAIDKVVHKSAV